MCPAQQGQIGQVGVPAGGPVLHVVGLAGFGGDPAAGDDAPRSRAARARRWAGVAVRAVRPDGQRDPGPQQGRGQCGDPRRRRGDVPRIRSPAHVGPARIAAGRRRRLPRRVARRDGAGVRRSVSGQCARVDTIGVTSASHAVNRCSAAVRVCPREVVHTWSPRVVDSRVTDTDTGNPPRVGIAPVAWAALTRATSPSARRADAGYVVGLGSATVRRTRRSRRSPPRPPGGAAPRPGPPSPRSGRTTVTGPRTRRPRRGPGSGGGCSTRITRATNWATAAGDSCPHHGASSVITPASCSTSRWSACRARASTCSAGDHPRRPRPAQRRVLGGERPGTGQPPGTPAAHPRASSIAPSPTSGRLPDWPRRAIRRANSYSTPATRRAQHLHIRGRAVPGQQAPSPAAPHPPRSRRRPRVRHLRRGHLHREPPPAPHRHRWSACPPYPIRAPIPGSNTCSNHTKGDRHHQTSGRTLWTIPATTVGPDTGLHSRPEPSAQGPTACCSSAADLTPPAGLSPATRFSCTVGRSWS